MKTLERDATISEKSTSLVATVAVVSHSLTVTGDDCLKNRDAWQDLFDYTLVEWGLDPSRFAEDGLLPPSAKALEAACCVAMRMRDYGKEPPLRVVPNGDGGIVFERSQGEIFETIEIQEDGSVEWAAFRNGRLCSRSRWV